MESLKKRDVLEIIRLAERCYPDTGEIKVVSLADIPLDTILGMKQEERELNEKVDSLRREELVELCALMWLGRGAGGEEADDFPELVEEAKDRYGEATVDYITEKQPLAEYLREGLRKLNL